MSLPKHKRIKYYNPDGTEVFEEEDRWAIVRAVHSAPEVCNCRRRPSVGVHASSFLTGGSANKARSRLAG